MPHSANLLSHPKYRPDIDGLRAVSILSVVAYHAFPSSAPGGFTGVDVFFVISGYLISSILFENLGRGTFSFAEFYQRRITRIFPALLLVLSASLAFGWFGLFADEYMSLGKHVAAGAGFVSNFALWDEAGYFDPASDTKPLLHLWSLGIEEQFYIAWPLLLWLATKLRLSLPLVTLLAAAASFGLNLAGFKVDGVATFYSPQTRIWELLAGSLLAWYSLNAHAGRTLRGAAPASASTCSAGPKTPRIRTSWTLNVASIGGLGMLVFGFLRLDNTIAFPGIGALVPTLGAALVIHAGANAWANRKILAHPVAVWLGLISYPLYLWHWPLLSYARIVEGDTPGLAERAAAVLAAILLSWLTYTLVERPLRSVRAGRVVSLLLAGLMVMVGCSGYSLFMDGGLRFRHLQMEKDISQLTYEFPGSEWCSSRHPYAPATSCYESRTSHPKSVFLVGDSHMEALAHGFITLVERGELGLNVIAIGKGGCNPFVDTESVNHEGTAMGCNEIISSALREASSRTDVVWVVLVGRHAARFNGLPFGRAEQEDFRKPLTYRYSGRPVAPSEAFSAGLAETIRLFAGTGKKVLFVHQVPELGFDPRKCLGRFDGVKKLTCSVDRQVVEHRLGPYKAAVGRILAGREGIAEFDPQGLVCNDTRCSPFGAGGDLMYRDDDHASKIAALQFARDIKSRILESR